MSTSAGTEFVVGGEGLVELVDVEGFHSLDSLVDEPADELPRDRGARRRPSSPSEAVSAEFAAVTIRKSHHLRRPPLLRP